MLGGRGFFRGSSILSRARPAPQDHSSPQLAKRLPGAGSAPFSSRRGIAQPDHPHSIPSGCAWSRWSSAACCGFTRARPLSTAWKCIWPRCSGDRCVFNPVVIVDPHYHLMTWVPPPRQGMVTRLVDYLKDGQVTSLFTSLTHGGHVLQQSEARHVLRSWTPGCCWKTSRARRNAIACLTCSSARHGAFRTKSARISDLRPWR